MNHEQRVDRFIELVKENPGIKNSTLVKMLYETTTRDSSNRISSLCQAATKKGFVSYFDAGGYYPVDYKDKPKIHIKNELVRFVHTNGIGGIHALWGR
jgi:hypothetical protein